MKKCNYKFPPITSVKKRIIEALQENGRASLVSLANKLKMTHVGVRKHLKNLVDNDVIRIQANLNRSS